ncbi:Ras-related protein Rab-18 [Halotydeus destructor]|nr:Ras-related protein Rab-18 [Halotydeus destructor]
MARQRCLLKVVVIGESMVGKTSLLLRMTEKTFFPDVKSTADIELKKVTMIIDDIEVILAVWDTVGQDRHKAVAGNYYRNADAALLVYDVNNVDTLNALDYWSNEVDHYCGNPRVIKILVGNKLDLVPQKRQPSVRPQQAIKWATARSVSNWLQTSAKSGHNVANAFEALIRLTTKFQDVEGATPLGTNPKAPIRLKSNDIPERKFPCCW